MLGTRYIAAYTEEGRAAYFVGKETFHNPYDFVWETQAAYAWEAGYRSAAKEDRSTRQ